MSDNFAGIHGHVSERAKQHLDNVRRKDPLRGAETTEIFVRLGNYSASHFEGSASSPARLPPRGRYAPQTAVLEDGRHAPAFSGFSWHDDRLQRWAWRLHAENGTDTIGAAQQAGPAPRRPGWRVGHP